MVVMMVMMVLGRVAMMVMMVLTRVLMVVLGGGDDGAGKGADGCAGKDGDEGGDGCGKSEGG